MVQGGQGNKKVNVYFTIFVSNNKSTYSRSEANNLKFGV